MGTDESQLCPVCQDPVAPRRRQGGLKKTMHSDAADGRPCNEVAKFLAAAERRAAEVLAGRPWLRGIVSGQFLAVRNRLSWDPQQKRGVLGRFAPMNDHRPGEQAPSSPGSTDT